jgi:hypothetical protein
MNRIEELRRQAEYNQYEIQRLQDKEMRKNGTHSMEHFTKQHNEISRPGDDEMSSSDEDDDDEEKEAPKSAFESLLPVAAVGAAGAVIGYRNRKTIRKGVKAVKAGAKAVGKAAKGGLRRIKARFGR